MEHWWLMIPAAALIALYYGTNKMLQKGMKSGSSKKAKTSRLVCILLMLFSVACAVALFLVWIKMMHRGG